MREVQEQRSMVVQQEEERERSRMEEELDRSRVENRLTEHQQEKQRLQTQIDQMRQMTTQLNRRVEEKTLDIQILQDQKERLLADTQKKQEDTDKVKAELLIQVKAVADLVQEREGTRKQREEQEMLLLQERQQWTEVSME